MSAPETALHTGLSTIDWAIVVVYLIASLVIGLVLEKRASRGVESFFLADRKLPWWALGASGMAANTDISGVLIGAAFLYALGVQGFYIEFRGGVVLVMAFLLAFTGKWNRRASVVTLAEWMSLRFGQGRAGKLARTTAALAILLGTVPIVAYFAKGASSFVGPLLGIEESTASLAMVALSLVYTVSSGLYGVVWTDVFQGALIFVGIACICALAFLAPDLPATFHVSVPLGHGAFQSVETTREAWLSAWPSRTLHLPGEYAVYDAFAWTIGFYLLKTVIEGASGGGGYMLQRFLAAKSEREVAKLSIFWTVLLAFRWPMVAALAFLAVRMGVDGHAIENPENVLSSVIERLVPSGMKGLLVACFMAAFMSTFSAIVNSAAAYWVQDLYAANARRAPSQRALVWHGRIASIAIVALGVLLSFGLGSVNAVWGFLTSALAAGLGVPLFMRWYWWRFNGEGFAIGMGAGMLAAGVSQWIAPDLSEPASFALVAVISLCGCILGTFAFPPTEPATLTRFYRTTRPFGFWKPLFAELSDDEQRAWRSEHWRDILALGLAMPWQITMFLGLALLAVRSWAAGGCALAVSAALGVALWAVWYRKLPR